MDYSYNKEAVVKFYFVKKQFEKGSANATKYNKTTTDSLKNYLNILQIVLAKYHIDLPTYVASSTPYAGCKCSITEQTIAYSDKVYKTQKHLEENLINILVSEDLYHAKNVEFIVEIVQIMNKGKSEEFPINSLPFQQPIILQALKQQQPQPYPQHQDQKNKQNENMQMQQYQNRIEQNFYSLNKQSQDVLIQKPHEFNQFDNFLNQPELSQIFKQQQVDDDGSETNDITPYDQDNHIFENSYSDYKVNKNDKQREKTKQNLIQENQKLNEENLKLDEENQKLKRMVFQLIDEQKKVKDLLQKKNISYTFQKINF